MPTRRERDGKRDGFLSTYGEWHALTIGVYDGVTSMRGKYGARREEFGDVGGEAWYYMGGFVVGKLVWLVLFVVAMYVMGV